MKRRTLYLLMIGLLLASAALVTGKVRAADSCFTDVSGHWAEAFICWMADNNISSGYPDGTFRPGNPITRAEVSALLSKQVELPPTTGLIIVSEGPGNWRAEKPGEVIFEVKPDVTEVKTATTASSVITLHPAVPMVLYGKRLSLAAVQVCFEGNPTAYLDRLEVYAPVQSTWPATPNLLWSSDTNRTTALCSLVGFAPPGYLLDFNNSVSVSMIITWTDSASVFKLGRAAIHLQPGSTSFVAPWSFSQDLLAIP